MRYLKIKLIDIIPLILILSYLLLTIFLFFVGPFYWPIENEEYLILFLVAILVFISVGYFRGAIATVSKSNKFNWYSVYKVGIWAFILLLAPMSYAYTGKFPWQVISALKDQKSTYLAMQKIIHSQSLAREIVTIIRIAFFPWILAAIPLAILNWKKISTNYKVMFFIFLLCQCIFSVLRGTDKEIADITVVLFISFLIRFVRLYYAGEWKFNFSIIVKIIVGMLVFMLVFSLFTERKLARTQYSVKPYCTLHNILVSPGHQILLPNLISYRHPLCAVSGKELITLLTKKQYLTPFCTHNNICASYSAPILSLFGDKNKFAISLLSLYLSEGYYGLSLALSPNFNFESTYGLGHSIVLTTMYDKLFNADLYKRSYLYKIKQTGKWSDSDVYSTMFPWIANDISFPFVPLFMALLAFILAKTWQEAVKENNDYAAILFVLLFALFLYAPANNQFAQTLDSYYGFCFWLFMWYVKSKKINLSLNTLKFLKSS